MLTPLTIMSLDQGREFARQEMKRIYAEPAEAAAEIIAQDAVEVASNEAVAREPKGRSLFAGFIGLRDAGYSVSTRRC